MKEFTLRQGLNALNLFLVAVFLVLALYSAIGQQIFPYVGQYRSDIERYLSDQFESVVGIRTLDGDMNILTPSIHMEGVTFASVDNPDSPSLSIAAIDAVLDPRASLFNLTPVFKSVRLSGLSVRVDARERNASSTTVDPTTVQKLVESLLLQRHLELNNVTVELMHKRQSKLVQLDHLVMTGDGFNRLMSGSLSYGEQNRIKAGIRLFSQGSPYNLDEFYARGVLDLPQLDVDYWLEELAELSVFKSFNASAQMSIEFKDGLLNYAKLNLASPEVSLPKQYAFSSVNSEIWLKQNTVDSWTLWLEDLQYTHNQKKWHIEDAAVKLSKTLTGNTWHAYYGDLDIPYVRELAGALDLLPDSITPILSELDPSGSIQNASLIVKQDVEAEADFTFVGELKGVSTNASDGIPAVGNLTGVVAASKDGGRVQFSGEQLKLAFPNIYDAPFEFESGSGQVDWFLRDHEIAIVGNGLSLKSSQVESITGGFDVVLPNSELLDGAIELNLTLTNAQVTSHSFLVPRIAGTGLRTWLNQSLLKGLVTNGHFYLYSDLSDSNTESQLELHLQPRNVTLAYLPEWPSVEIMEGHLFIENDTVMAGVDIAQTLGGVMSDGQILYQDDALWVSSEVTGDANDILDYFKVTPLNTISGDILKEWSLLGRHDSQLKLWIPLEGEESVLADVSSNIHNADLDLSDLDLEFTNLNGQIKYRTSDGLRSDGITGQIWNEPLQASIQSKHDGQLTDIRFKSHLNAKRLKDWLSLELLSPLKGRSGVRGHFYIDTRDDGFTGLTLESDLAGIEMNLPAPFGLTKDEQAPLNFSLEIQEQLIMKMSYDDHLNLALSLQDGALDRGQIYLGKTEAYIPSEPGVMVQGHLDSLPLNDWFAVWEGIAKHSPPAEGKNPIREVKLSADKLNYDDFNFEHVKFEIKNLDPTWQFNVDAPIAKGVVELTPDQPIKLDLEYIHWPMIVDQESKEDDADALASVQPDALPNIQLDVDEIFIGPTNYGRWSLRSETFKNGIRLTDIDGEIKKLKVKGDVEWSKPIGEDAPQYTFLDLNLSSNDVGGIQAAWKQKPVVEAESGKARVKFKWLGSPTDFDMASLNGDFNLHLKDGRFIEAGEAGALGAFGILNFGAIGRRLRLDFTDVYQSGIHFDSVKGKGVVNNGVLHVVDTFNVDGPAAKLAMSGQVNMLTQELNQELSVTFPISSTLPFVAILAGFAPPVAASLFVGERLVGDEIEKYTSATYGLTGKWDDPKLKLKKRFDNDIEGKKEKSFWHRMKDIFGLGDD